MDIYTSEPQAIPCDSCKAPGVVQSKRHGGHLECDLPSQKQGTSHGKRGQTHLVGIGSDRGKMGTNIAQKSKQIVPKKSFCLKSCAREGVDKDERDSGKTDSKAKRS